MKAILFGDVHGYPLNHLKNFINIENIDYLICTGDFDQIKTLREFMEIENEFISLGKSTILVPGSHDYAVLHNIDLHSGTLDRQSTSIQKLHEELMTNKKELEYMNKLMATNKNSFLPYSKTIKLKDINTIVTHAGYTGPMRSHLSCLYENRGLWVRLDTKEHYEDNFREMFKNSNQLMIRGHDHHQKTFEMGFEEKGRFLDISKKIYIDFSKNKYILNPGALFNGDFAIMDFKDNYTSLEYKKL